MKRVGDELLSKLDGNPFIFCDMEGKIGQSMAYCLRTTNDCFYGLIRNI